MSERGEPALLKHCRNAYDLIEEKSELQDEEQIYSGKITATLLGRKGINSGNYSSIIRRLKEMGCIEYLSVGSATTTTVIRLIHPPDLTKFIATADAQQRSRKKDAAVQQQLTDIVDRITALEASNRVMRRKIELLELGQLDD